MGSHQLKDYSLEVSVIVPAFQAASTIGRALSSVAHQTHLPREIIVVDDGSDDKTSEVAASFRSILRGIELKIFRQVNHGAGAARNKAINEAQCDLVAFLDADDEWLPKKVELSIQHLVSGDHVLVAHNGWIHDRGTEKYLDIASRFRAAHPSLFHALYRRGFISTSSVVAKRQSILNVGGFDEELSVGQDFDLWLKLLHSHDRTFIVFDEPLTRYHITSGSITSQIDKRLACTLEIANRHARKLLDHKGSQIASLVFRTIAIHMEALRSHAGQCRFLAATRVIGLLLLRLVKMLVILPKWEQKIKLHHQDRIAVKSTDGRRFQVNTFSGIVSWSLWFWIAAAFSGYLLQFKKFIRPILSLLGL